MQDYPVVCNSHNETGHGGKKHHTSLPASAEILNLTNSQVKTEKKQLSTGLGDFEILKVFFLTNQKEQRDSHLRSQDNFNTFSSYERERERSLCVFVCGTG